MSSMEREDYNSAKAGLIAEYLVSATPISHKKKKKNMQPKKYGLPNVNKLTDSVDNHQLYQSEYKTNKPDSPLSQVFSPITIWGKNGKNWQSC